MTKKEIRVKLPMYGLKWICWSGRLRHRSTCHVWINFRVFFGWSILKTRGAKRSRGWSLEKWEPMRLLSSKYRICHPDDYLCLLSKNNNYRIEVRWVEARTVPAKSLKTNSMSNASSGTWTVAMCHSTPLHLERAAAGVIVQTWGCATQWLKPACSWIASLSLRPSLRDFWKKNEHCWPLTGRSGTQKWRAALWSVACMWVMHSE